MNTPIRSVSKQFADLQRLNVKLKMFDLGEIRMATGKDGHFYYYYNDPRRNNSIKTRKTLIGIKRYASAILREKEAENHGY